MSEDAALKAALNLESTAVGAVKGFVESLYLGNVHGFSVSGAIDTINQASVASLSANIGNIM